jgi:hypothetical protein
MWKRHRGLWVVNEDRKTADRPHAITIAIGIFSPALAVIALIVSIMSLRTSDRSLKVANRAYVNVVSGSLLFSDFGYVVQEKGPDAGTHLIVRMDLFARLQNAGNSPASVGDFKPRYQLPPGWSEAPSWVKTRLNYNGIGMIAPKSTLNWAYTELFELTPNTYNAFRNFPGRAFVYMHATFNYKDVFNETNEVAWCWAAAGNEKTTSTTDCARTSQMVFAAPTP